MARLVLTALALSLASACGGVARPAADPGPDRTVDVGETVVFDGSASRGQIDSYTWDFGDGSPGAQGVRVEHAFAQEGDYSVSLTVRGPGGVSTQAAVVHVGQSCLPIAVLDVLTADPKPGEPVQLSGGNSAPCAGRPIEAWHWDFGDGTVADGTTQPLVTHTYAEKGTYLVALEVEDSRGAKGRATRSLNVGVAAGRPLVQCSGPTTATPGVPATFTASAQDPAGEDVGALEWTFGDDGSTATGSSVNHVFDAEGTFTTSVTATTVDQRTSVPCTVTTTVSAPASYSGTWLLNPSSPSLGGCSKFTVGFPATHLGLVHSGTTLTADPSGNGWPGTTLTGMEDAQSPGTFRVRGTLPQEDRSAAGCGPVVPEHSVQLTFTSATTVSGTWRAVYDFPCIPGCPVTCNCVATGAFTGKKL